MAMPALAGPVPALAGGACHAEAPHDLAFHAPADASEEGAARQGDDDAPVTHACATCAICHGCMSAPAGGLASPGSSPRSGPPAAHPRDTGRLWVAALERPPRA